MYFDREVIIQNISQHFARHENSCSNDFRSFDSRRLAAEKSYKNTPVPVKKKMYIYGSGTRMLARRDGKRT